MTVEEERVYRTKRRKEEGKCMYYGDEKAYSKEMRLMYI